MFLNAVFASEILPSSEISEQMGRSQVENVKLFSIHGRGEFTGMGTVSKYRRSEFELVIYWSYESIYESNGGTATSSSFQVGYFNFSLSCACIWMDVKKEAWLQI